MKELASPQKCPVRVAGPVVSAVAGLLAGADPAAEGAEAAPHALSVRHAPAAAADRT
jgi:hypothetical protein